MSYEFMPCTNFGGAAALYHDLATALVRLGHDVVILSGNNRPGVDVVTQNGMTNIRFGARYPSIGFVGRLWRAFEVLRRHKLAEDLSSRFDIIEAPEFASEHLLLGVLGRGDAMVTRLISPSFMVARMSGREPSKVQSWFERESASRSSAILADSSNWGLDILREWKLEHKRFRECPLGISLSRIDEVPLAPSGITERYVLFCGRLTVAKGPQVLAAAAPRFLKAHPDTKIVFAGADRLMPSGQSMREAIIQSVPGDLRDSFVFLGRVDSWPALVNLYRGASICVKADSYGNHSFDTMGQMACSRPLVCTRTEGNIDLIDDGVNGHLFDRQSPEQLAEILVDLMGDRQRRAALGKNARRTVEERFSSEIMASKTVEVYSEVLS